MQLFILTNKQRYKMHMVRVYLQHVVSNRCINKLCIIIAFCGHFARYANYHERDVSV